MTYAMTKTVAKLHPILQDGHLSLERLFHSGPISGESIHIGQQELLATWRAAAKEEAQAKHVQMGELDPNRTLRKLHEKRLCLDLANMATPVLMEYDYRYRGVLKRKLMLSRGACDMLVVHARVSQEGGVGSLTFSERQLVLLERAGGLVGEFKENELPSLTDISALLLAKIAAAEPVSAV